MATPIEQQISGVDNMNYMYSVNANNGTMRLTASFDVETNPNTDLVLTQIRQNLSQPQLPARRAQLRRHGPEIPFRPPDDPFRLFTQWDPRRQLSCRIMPISI